MNENMRAVGLLVLGLILGFVPEAQSEDLFELAFESTLAIRDWDAHYVETGDFNGDGYPDFVATCYDYNFSGSDFRYIYTFLNNGDFTFNQYIDVTLDYPIGCITVSDFNNDGYDDILIGEGGHIDVGEPCIEDSLHLLRSNGDGTFTEVNTIARRNLWVTSGDLNDDGNSDFIVAVPHELTDQDTVGVYLGNGDFTFQQMNDCVIDEVILHTVQILGDMDLDGYSDIGLITKGGDIFFLYGNGDGTFQPPVKVVNYFPAGPYKCFIAPGDFDEDSIPDFAATIGGIMAGWDQVFCWEGYEYVRTDSLSWFGEEIEVHDFDLDGHLDVILTKMSYPSEIWPGAGDGTFLSASQITSLDGHSVSSADFDLDGDMDLVYFEYQYWDPYYVRCYRNTTINLGIGEEAEAPHPIDLIASPNPFTTSVSISVESTAFDMQPLAIFDVSGHLVAELQPAVSGDELIYCWNGTSSSDAEAPSGIYSARIRSEEVSSGVMLLKLK